MVPVSVSVDPPVVGAFGREMSLGTAASNVNSVARVPAMFSTVSWTTGVPEPFTFTLNTTSVLTDVHDVVVAMYVVPSPKLLDGVGSIGAKFAPRIVTLA